jgi:hypothetical protein
MAERHPMTIQQRQVLKKDLAELREKLAGVVSLIRAVYGENTEPFVRARIRIYWLRACGRVHASFYSDPSPQMS